MPNKDFSALRLKKENIAVFQDLKIAYESRNFARLSNDEFFEFLTGRVLTSDLELSADYDRVLRQRYGVDESIPDPNQEDMPEEITGDVNPIPGGSVEHSSETE